MRQRTATAALLALLVVPVLATVWIGTQYTNLLGTVLIWVFVGLMAPEIVTVVRRHHDALLGRAMLAGGALCVAGWTLSDRPWVTESRFWLYVGIVALVPAFAAWVSWTRSSGLRTLVVTKTALTLLAVALVAGALIQDARPDSLPLYRNVRHLNYDVALLLVVLAYLVQVVRSRMAMAGLMVLIGSFGWFAVWSGGRAQLVALGVVALVLVVAGAVRWSRPRVWLVPAGLGLAALGVVLGGGSHLLTRQVSRTVTQDVSELTSGRVHLWRDGIAHLDGPAALLFGRGPDAFDRLRLGPPSIMGADHRIVQPHNTLVQWLLEFGLVGTVLIVGLSAWLLIRAARTVRGHGVAPERRVAAAMLIGLFAYAQLDGVFYHVVPLTLAALFAGMTLFAVDGSGSRPPEEERTADDPQDSSSRVRVTSSRMAATSASTPSNRTIPRIRSTKETSTSAS